MRRGTRTGEWAERKRKSVREIQSMKMLNDFLNAQTPQDKRRVIESFNPYYFLLTTPTQGDSNEPRL